MKCWLTSSALYTRPRHTMPITARSTGTGNGRKIAGSFKSRTRPANSNALPRSKRNWASNTPPIHSGNTESTRICCWGGRGRNGGNDYKVKIKKRKIQQQRNQRDV